MKNFFNKIFTFLFGTAKKTETVNIIEVLVKEPVIEIKEPVLVQTSTCKCGCTNPECQCDSNCTCKNCNCVCNEDCTCKKKKTPKIKKEQPVKNAPKKKKKK